MLLIADDIFSLLEFAAYGAYAVSVDQTILYWNPAAERILGHRASDVIGRRCYDVVAGRGARGVAQECLGGCPSIRYMRAGLLPSPLRLQMLCSSGERKWVSVTPMAVTGILGDSHAIVHMFEEAPGPPDSEQTEDSPRDTVADARNVTPTNVAAGARSEEAPSLSLREQEVLHLVGTGLGDHAHCRRTGHQPTHGAQSRPKSAPQTQCEHQANCGSHGYPLRHT